MKKENEALLMFCMMIFMLVMAPFMIVGHLWAETLNKMEMFYGEGWHRLYGWAIHWYGVWPRADGMEQGFATIKVAIAVIIYTPMMYVVGVIGVYVGLGVYLYRNPIALTPWDFVNQVGLPVLVGLAQFVGVLWLFRNKPKAPLFIATVPAIAIPFMFLVLPFLLMILTGVHTLLH